MILLMVFIISFCTPNLFSATTNRLFISWAVALDWDTNVTIHVYSTTNLALPVAEWPHLTNIDFITATNSAKFGEGGRVEIPPAEDVLRFYALTASNFVGQSDFSDPVSVRRSSRGTGLKIGAW